MQFHDAAFVAASTEATTLRGRHKATNDLVHPLNLLLIHVVSSSTVSHN
jgi:hypothetical protein